MGPAAGVTRHAAKLAAALVCATSGVGCGFHDDVTIGRDVAVAGSGGSSTFGGTAGAGSGGAAPFAGGGGGKHGPPPATGGSDACGLGPQVITGYVMPRDSVDPMTEGMGGDVQPGTYRLVALVEHGSCGCFDANVPLHQTLVLETATGFVISDTAQGEHWAATFRYTTRGNTFTVEPTCSEVSRGVSGPGPFGSFGTYTVTEDSLWLISPSCHYRAAYWRVPAPPAR